MANDPERCRICQRLLNDELVPESLDCGGDCLECMAVVADDPDCVRAMMRISRERHHDHVCLSLIVSSYLPTVPKGIAGWLTARQDQVRLLRLLSIEENQ